MTAINIFNSSPEDVIVEINGGPPLQIPATGDTSGWVAQQPEDVIQWSDHVSTPGQMRYGGNYVKMYRPGQDRTLIPFTTLDVPVADTAVTSLQLYIFWHGAQDLAWIFLQDGKPLTSGNMLFAALKGL